MSGLSAEPRQERAAAARVATGMHILVVDDEPELADLAGALLRAYGFRVSVVYRAADVLLALANDKSIGALFSDVVMPGMNGLELAAAVRQRHPQVRIVLTSGYASLDLLDKRRQPYPCAPKPYKIASLVGMLLH